MASYDNFINTDLSYISLSVTPSNYCFKRKLIKTANNTTARNEISNITMTPKDSWYMYVEDEYIVVWQGSNVLVQAKDYYGNILKQEILTGQVGQSYTTTPFDISGYDLISIPPNVSGVFAEQEIIVEYKYDLVNVAKVRFEDLLSDVVLAKYWYNSENENFTGEGSNFENGAIFEDYGYYKIMVQNSVGLKNENIFILDKNSLKR